MLFLELIKKCLNINNTGKREVRDFFEGERKMEQKESLFTDFVQKDRFELKSYLSYLFNHYKKHLHDDRTLDEKSKEYSERPYYPV